MSLALTAKHLWLPQVWYATDRQAGPPLSFLLLESFHPTPPSPSLPHPPTRLSLSLFTFANQLWACFLLHPNKWHVNPAGTAGWKWVLKGISKWHFNKDAWGDIMGPNESNALLMCWQGGVLSVVLLSQPCGIGKGEKWRGQDQRKWTKGAI